jgi:protein-S-isoprenylcysteine O-methyltransferase Ste14
VSRKPDLHAFLEALGVRTPRPRVRAALIIAVFELSFVAICVVQAVAEWKLGLSPPLVVAAVWVVWTYWHSVLFPRRRLRYVRDAALPYRAAFMRDIYPWVTLGFSQMWRPVFSGEVLGDTIALLERGSFSVPWVRLAVAAAIATAALVVMIDAIRTIGFANAAFVSEFVGAAHFQPIERGVYANLRHPLFAAGALYSVALAVAVFTPTAFWIAAINCLYVGVYSPLEDRRMRRVFGDAYASYERSVPALAVRWRGSSAASAGADRREQEVPRAAAVEGEEEEQWPGQEVAPAHRGEAKP